MKILAFTSIRSEYDLMSSLFFKLHEDPEVELKLLVGGTHNSPSFGMTIEDIISDGFDTLKVESLIDGDSTSSRLKSASLLLISSIDMVQAFKPDLILYAGDREDVLVAAMLAGYLAIPSIHFFGGDHACDGHIDNPVRHATSKLSTCHFVSTSEHKQRLLALGELESRIFNVGSVALDKFHEIEPDLSIPHKIAGAQISKPIALFIFHPVDTEVGVAAEIVTDVINELINQGFYVFIGAPNSDYGNSGVRRAVAFYENHEDATVYGNLPRKAFVQLFKNAQVIIGNSSAGLLEAASIPIPCVNVGERQRGRFCGPNVQFVGTSKSEISAAIKKASSEDYLKSISEMVNPYGEGRSSEKAYKLIKNVDFLSMLKKKEDPLENE